MNHPTPQERFEYASQNAALIRALLSHPSIRLDANGLPSRSGTHPTLYNVTDFQLNTYKNYLLPLLPPDAAKNSRALSSDPKAEITERTEMLADELYPRMQVGGFLEKWRDAIGRGVMISSIILNPGQQVMFGGAFEFGDEVKEAARAMH